MINISKLTFGLLIWLGGLISSINCDIGIVSFWVPEMYALLEQVRLENNTIEEYIFGARKFYVTQYRGHNVILVNTGVGISNAAATLSIMLQKFPTIDRVVGSGIAGGIDPSLRVGDVVIPQRWSMYQKQHFAKEEEDGSHEIPGWTTNMLLGNDCGAGFTSDTPAEATTCEVGSTTWNYTLIYPTASYGADPNIEGETGTIEGDRVYGWFEVDSEMYAVAQTVAESTELANEVGDVSLDYQPLVRVGGNGVAGPTFVDNADFRNYVFETFTAVAVDMESSALASVCKQFGVPFIVFRSLSDLAGGESEGNVLSVFFGVAAANAVTTMTAFLEALPLSNAAETLPEPNDHSPGEDTPGLLGVLSFYKPELDALLAIMNAAETMIFGGRKFYRGTIHGANVVATLTGVSIENAAASTALMLQLYPGVERLTGGGIAGGVDPSLQIGDVVIPDQWAMYQMQIYGKDLGNGIYEPVDFEQDIIVGKNCGGWDGVSRYLFGDAACDWEAGEASNFEFIYPKTIQTPDPNAEDSLNQISEGNTRKFWFSVDETMLEAAKKVANTVTLLNSTDDFELDYTPKIVVGGNGVSGPTFVDNVRYREYVFEEFEAQCLDMETAATAHIAFQHDVPFLFFRSLSDLAGADQDGNVMGVFFSIAATNAFTVMSAFIEELYPHLVSNETEQPEAPTAETADSSKLKPSQALFLVAVLLATSFLI
ncbi:methylthioadenosine/S-adenosylhomocysteine MTA/SAH nucleosidase [Nitzschia inconspicua]|uniref:Methylthioadenosine/S-adenosylhomocysteine MTA/SAH nucleosidase n=1 Tax=Nitzschia inconspicua TaxID=303405 RepID=A0A9K3Q937_9STRA|nr:methylthioadenosine/S-adenosylhomocysteine MTA/SAH nucleosidase [Nitzschia inconspicua]